MTKFFEHYRDKAAGLLPPDMFPDSGIPKVEVATSGGAAPWENLVRPGTDGTMVNNNVLEIKFRDKMFIVPAGFKCDGASIPGFLWNKISAPVDPRTLRGAIAHDYLYRNFVPGWDRKEADDLFYQLIREDGLSWFRSQIAYAGVRMFGKGAWQHDEH